MIHVLNLLFLSVTAFAVPQQSLQYTNLKCTESYPSLMSETTWVNPSSICTLQLKGAQLSTLELYINRKKPEIITIDPNAATSEVRFSLKRVSPSHEPVRIEVILQSGKKFVRLREQLKMIPLPPQRDIETCQNSLDTLLVRPVWLCNHPQGLTEFTVDRKKNNQLIQKKLSQLKPQLFPASSTGYSALSHSFFRIHNDFLVMIDDHLRHKTTLRTVLPNGMTKKVGVIHHQNPFRLGPLAEVGNSELFLYDFAPHFLGREHNTIAPSVYSVSRVEETLQLKKRYDQLQFCKKHVNLCGGEIQFHYFDSDTACLRFDVFNLDHSPLRKITECL